MTPQPYRSAGPLLRPLRRQGRHQRPPRPPFGRFPLPAPGREVRAGAAWRKQKKVGRGGRSAPFAPRSPCPPRAGRPRGASNVPEPQQSCGARPPEKSKKQVCPKGARRPFLPHTFCVSPRAGWPAGASNAPKTQQGRTAHRAALSFFIPGPPGPRAALLPLRTGPGPTVLSGKRLSADSFPARSCSAPSEAD